MTSTVEAIPLIASSIMSKKIAEGTDALVLDVKVGSGAFLPELDRARAWPRRWSASARRTACGRRAADRHGARPRAAGNGLEVIESIEGCRAAPADLREVTLALPRRDAGAGRPPDVGAWRPRRRRRPALDAFVGA